MVLFFWCFLDFWIQLRIFSTLAIHLFSLCLEPEWISHGDGFAKVPSERNPSAHGSRTCAGSVASCSPRRRLKTQILRGEQPKNRHLVVWKLMFIDVYCSGLASGRATDVLEDWPGQESWPFLIQGLVTSSDYQGFRAKQFYARPWQSHVCEKQLLRWHHMQTRGPRGGFPSWCLDKCLVSSAVEPMYCKVQVLQLSLSKTQGTKPSQTQHMQWSARVISILTIEIFLIHFHKWDQNGLEQHLFGIFHCLICFTQQFLDFWGSTGSCVGLSGQLGHKKWVSSARCRWASASWNSAWSNFPSELGPVCSATKMFYDVSICFINVLCFNKAYFSFGWLWMAVYRTCFTSLSLFNRSFSSRFSYPGQNQHSFTRQSPLEKSSALFQKRKQGVTTFNVLNHSCGDLQITCIQKQFTKNGESFKFHRGIFATTMQISGFPILLPSFTV